MALDSVAVYFGTDSAYMKTLLFEIKHYRNLWAHQAEFNVRQVYRVVDSVLFVAEGMSFEKRSEIYIKLVDIQSFCMKKLAQSFGLPR